MINWNINILPCFYILHECNFIYFENSQMNVYKLPLAPDNILDQKKHKK